MLAEQQCALFEAPGQAEDRRHWDEVLTGAGVRWCVLRHVPRVARRDLALQVLAREAPEGTRRAESATLWLDEVRRRVETTSVFKRGCSRRVALRVAEAYAQCVDHERRPLTWVTQEEIAAAAGRSDRTVRRYLAWLRAEGLLFELVPGTRVPSMDRPEDETEAEATARQQREAEGIRAEEAARQRAGAALKAHKDADRRAARAEIEAVRAGQRGTAAVELAAASAEPLDLPDLHAVLDEARAVISAANEATLINLAPVYELRVPMSEAELIEAAETREAMTSANMGAARTGKENVHPPYFSLVDQEGSDCVRLVDKSRRFAPQGHERGQLPRNGSGLDAAGVSDGSEGDRTNRRSSRALRAAEALLGAWLDRKVSHGVSKRWLAARIRGTGLLDRGWSVQDLAEQIHGLPERPHLPRHIRSPRAWIHARLSEASPLLPPSKAALVREVERTAGQERARVRQAAEATAKRAAIEACRFCDETGWIEVADPAVGAIRCNHDEDTGGW